MTSSSLQTGNSAGAGRMTILKTNRWLLVLSFIVCAYMLFGRLGGLALISPDEGRNAEVAREMSQSHSWLVPTYDGLAYLDKPAFYFKTIALSFSLFGESEGVARLSSAFFGFSLLVVVFLFCRRVYDQRTAMLAILIVATTPLYIAFSRYVIFDMSLAFFVSATIFACFLAEECEGKQRIRWYLIGAFSAGIATLIKGPVGFIVPTLVIAIFNGVEGRLGVMKKVFAPRNWAVFFAVVLPWFVGLSLLRPDFPYYGIMRESVARFTTTEFHRTAPFYFYAPIIAGTFFAWSLLLPESVVAAWQERKRWSRADRLFVVWAIVVVLFFSVSQSKLPGYILTAIVALGILTARVFASALTHSAGRAARIVWHGTMPLLLLSTIMAVLLGTIALNPELLKSRLTFKHELFDLFIPTFLPMALSFGIVALLAALAIWTRNTRLVFAAFISFPLLLLTVNFDLLAIYAQTRSSRSLAERIPTTLPPTTELVCMECLPHGLPFYLKRQVTVLTRDGKELSSNYVSFTLNSGKPWPEGVVPLEQWQHWLATRTHPVYLLARKSHLALLKEIAQERGVDVVDLDSKYWAVLLPTPAGN
ncbi:MAG: glycosyltransferase family 39 protein [Methylococcaceae bacterium]|nr:glycosyltransferase family 39 protein [Methylococcaceae bacterium]OYV18243.1 MAG: dolichyl-phosphate-mannose-protein mannosyltransferase [Methylococcaceae bacterium NSM2-1]